MRTRAGPPPSPTKSPQKGAGDLKPSLHYPVILPSVTCCSASSLLWPTCLKQAGVNFAFIPFVFQITKGNTPLSQVRPSRNISRSPGHPYPVLIQPFIITYWYIMRAIVLITLHFCVSHIIHCRPPLSQQSSVVDGQSAGFPVFSLKKITQ